MKYSYEVWSPSVPLFTYWSLITLFYLHNIYFICIAYVMSYREQCPADCKVYVGGLPERASRGELEEIFGRFGPLRNVWVARRPWGFAFVEFEDARDAIDAVRQLDGSRMCGVRARVELSHGQRRNRGPRGYDDERRGGDRRRLHASPSFISR
ncbi:Serine/arginine-rich splicing factor 3 [Trichinella nativa]|uniref:Serine/arginine-rich splicing factor 3 n=1 Tax=Trichinella nativa TaxID=6335 RepID=A0A0V1LFB0_9BILA|nr:Serine/arginine-rich splicing factor 3 [Trichinella nativa]KRZ58231.1 Serine/arginine-rich splicing factor 3 [Trichinella nativa]